MTGLAMTSLRRTPPSLTVWGIGTPRTLRVHWALQELSCRYVTQPVLPRSEAARSAAYLAINPTGKVPSLVDGAYTLTESGPIVNYLMRRFGAAAGLQLPTNARQLGRYEEWASLSLMELDAAALYVMRRHVDLSHHYGPAAAAVEAAHAYARRVVATVARRLGTSHYTLGAAFSGADILLATSLGALHARGVALPATLTDFQQRLTSRRAYKLALDANTAPVAPDQPMPTRKQFDGHRDARPAGPRTSRSSLESNGPASGPLSV
jgi:glutathione S-transferase